MITRRTVELKITDDDVDLPQIPMYPTFSLSVIPGTFREKEGK